MLHRMWLPQLAPLSERYHVLAPDLLYDDLKQLTIVQLADDIGELIRRRSAAAAHVVGLSLGGVVATQLAISAPDNVRSLVISGAVVKADLLGGMLMRAIFSLMPERLVIKGFTDSVLEVYPDRSFAKLAKLLHQHVAAETQAAFDWPYAGQRANV